MAHGLRLIQIVYHPCLVLKHYTHASERWVRSSTSVALLMNKPIQVAEDVGISCQVFFLAASFAIVAKH